MVAAALGELCSNVIGAARQPACPFFSAMPYVCRTAGDNSQARDRPQGGSVIVEFIGRVGQRQPREGALWGPPHVERTISAGISTSCCRLGLFPRKDPTRPVA